MKKFSFTTTLELDVLVEGSGDPGYEPYTTQNHDDPRFSDPGASPEVDEFKVTIGGIDITKQLDKETLEEIEEIAMDNLLEDEDDYDDGDYEDDSDNWLEEARREVDDE